MFIFMKGHHTDLSFSFTEAVVQRCSVKKAFLEISQNSKENTCARVSLLLKERLWHKCFPVNFAKFLRIPFLTEHLCRLLLVLCHTWILRFQYRFDSPTSSRTICERQNENVPRMEDKLNLIL